MPYKIMGAGLAGLSTAIILARAGHEVKVVEKNESVGKNMAENTQAIRNYNLTQDQMQKFREKGLRIDQVRPIRKIIKYAPSGKKMTTLSEKTPLFYVLKRSLHKDSFDLQLYKQALEEGVEFEFNKKLKYDEADVISANNNLWNMWFYGFEFQDVNVNEQTILFFMDNNYAPAGYLYLIPYGKDELSIACASYVIDAKLPALLKKFLSENNIVKKLTENGTIKNAFSGKVYANVPKTAQRGDKKFIGAAGGFVEAARGFGVRYGIGTGILAAEAICNKTNYDYLWKNEFEAELLKNLKRRFLLEKLTNEEYEKLILGDEIGIREYTKIPEELRDRYEKIEFGAELKKWRERFRVENLVYS